MFIANRSDYLKFQNLNSKVAQVYERLQKEISTGNRINTASDDSAGLGISERLKAKVNAYDRGTQNLMDAKSLVQTVDGHYETAIDIIQRMRELGIQYQNGTLSESDKEIIQKEIKNNQEELSRLLGDIRFNRKNVTSTFLEGKLQLKNYGDSVVVNDHPQMDISSSNITMEAKVTLDAVPSGAANEDRFIVASKNGNYYLTVDKNSRVAIYKYGTSPQQYWVSSGTVPVGVETHIAGTFDETSAKIYINGALDNSFVLTGTGYEDRDLDFKIGFERNGYERQFQGTIDDVRIYEKSLSQTEIQDNIDGNVVRDGLVGEWLFNDGNSNVAYDSSGNNNYGTLNGGATIVATGIEKEILVNSGQNNKQLEIMFTNLDLQKLGLGDLSNIDQNVVSIMEKAIDTLTFERSYAGNLLNKIEFRIQDNQIASINHNQSKMKIKEADIAYVSGEMIKAELKQSSSLAMLQRQIGYDQGKIKLLQS